MNTSAQRTYPSAPSGIVRFSGIGFSTLIGWVSDFCHWRGLILGALLWTKCQHGQTASRIRWHVHEIVTISGRLGCKGMSDRPVAFREWWSDRTCNLPMGSGGQGDRPYWFRLVIPAVIPPVVTRLNCCRPARLDSRPDLREPGNCQDLWIACRAA
jgi:hypothetical protein